MSNPKTIPVWDIFIRLFHWSLVVYFLIAYASADDENPLHIYSGYTVLGLISFRVIWGLIGGRHARFNDFVRSPSVLWRYLQGIRSGHPQRYLGHNPLGGWMVVAMLLTLYAVTLSGLKVYAIEEGKGPYARFPPAQRALLSPAAAEDKEDDEKNDKADEQFWEEIHEASSNLMWVLIALHLSGIVISSRLHKENLVKAMLTGNKPADQG